jgi:TATA-binding protein-associated factor
LASHRNVEIHGTQDIASIGRIIGVQDFLTADSVREQREDAATYRKAKKLDDDGESLKIAEVLAVRRMQAQFSGHILRRTTDSVDWRGGSLLDLPPHKTIAGVLELTKREMDIIQKRAEDARSGQAFPALPPIMSHHPPLA